MPITLGPEHERLIAEALHSGSYESPDEVIKCALELLHQRDAWLAENRAKIEEGWAAAQRGDLVASEEVHTQLSNRKRTWLSEHPKG